MMDIKSPDVVFLGSTIEESVPRVIDGRYGEAGQVRMMNTYSVIQAEPRKMPNFWMVRPASEG